MAFGLAIGLVLSLATNKLLVSQLMAGMPAAAPGMETAKYTNHVARDSNHVACNASRFKSHATVQTHGKVAVESPSFSTPREQPGPTRRLS